MDSFLNNIYEIANTLSTKYNLNYLWFLIIYFLSFLPFYLGYLIMLYGTTRHLTFSDVLHFKFKHKIQWTPHATVGLIIHIFGRLMPYLFVVVFGKNLPSWAYVLVLIMSLLPILYLFKKLLFQPSDETKKQELSVEKLDIIEGSDRISLLWEIYDSAFEEVNKKSPCKQSFDYDHFIEALAEPTIIKYILKHQNGDIVGIAMVTNDFKNTTWISPDYFQENFPDKFLKKMVYYFMGIALHKKYHRREFSIMLIEHIIDDIPKYAVMGFDHSNNVNPLLHHFTKIVRQARTIKRTHIDRQHYHILERI